MHHYLICHCLCSPEIDSVSCSYLSRRVSSLSEDRTMSNDAASSEETEAQIAMSGWLMKRCRLTKKWKRTWFTLHSSHLSYGKSEAGPLKDIPLQCTAIEEAHIDNMKYVFRLRPPKSRREYLIQAPDEQSEQRWMQAICFAKVSASNSDSSQACCVQWCITQCPPFEIVSFYKPCQFRSPYRIPLLYKAYRYLLLQITLFYCVSYDRILQVIVAWFRHHMIRNFDI